MGLCHLCNTENVGLAHILGNCQGLSQLYRAYAQRALPWEQMRTQLFAGSESLSDVGLPAARICFVAAAIDAFAETFPRDEPSAT